MNECLFSIDDHVVDRRRANLKGSYFDWTTYFLKQCSESEALRVRLSVEVWLDFTFSPYNVFQDSVGFESNICKQVTRTNISCHMRKAWACTGGPQGCFSKIFRECAKRWKVDVPTQNSYKTAFSTCNFQNLEGKISCTSHVHAHGAKACQRSALVHMVQNLGCCLRRRYVHCKYEQPEQVRTAVNTQWHGRREDFLRCGPVMNISTIQLRTRPYYYPFPNEITCRKIFSSPHFSYVANIDAHPLRNFHVLQFQNPFYREYR